MTVTFVNPRQRGAILITKTRKHAATPNIADDPHPGVTFTVKDSGGNVVPGGFGFLVTDPDTCEATSAIDIDTEAAIFQSLSAERPDMTIIVVAHRPSTLAMCDRIIRLEGGRLADDSGDGVQEAIAG